ncbi:MAG: outer membrane beta-barrel protein [Leptospirales bacterium]|nr:outer membrane beta-barrel protein [Leptospirales bacterium]
MNKIFIVFSMMLCLSTIAWAEGADDYLDKRKIDISVYMGMYWPTNKLEVGNENYGFHAGHIIGIEGQYFFIKNIGVGVNHDYAYTETGNINIGGDISWFEINTRYLGPELILRYPKPKYDILLSAGFGQISNKFIGSGGNCNDCSEKDTNIGVLFQFEVRQYLTENVHAGVKLKYMSNKWSKEIMGEQVSANLRSWSMLQTIGYSF